MGHGRRATCSVDGRGALARSQTYDVRRRKTRYVSSIPATLQRFLRFGPISTRGVTLDVLSVCKECRRWFVAHPGRRNGCDRPVVSSSNIEMLASVSATAAMPGPDLSSTLLSPSRARGNSSRIWIEELRHTKKRCSPIRTRLGPRLATTKVRTHFVIW